MAVCAGAQPGKQARWAILAGSGLPTFKRRLASGFEQVPLALPTLNESARAEVVRQELVACKHASDVDATAIVADPGIKSLLDFTLGLPGALAVILQELSQLATRRCSSLEQTQRLLAAPCINLCCLPSRKHIFLVFHGMRRSTLRLTN